MKLLDRLLAKLGAGLLGLALCCGCSGGQVPPNVVTGITSGVNFAVCVLGQWAQCNASSTPWATCSVQIVQACGGDALSVAAVLDADAKAHGSVSPVDASAQ